MTYQEDIRERNALILAKEQRDNAVVEAEMNYFVQGVQAVARKVGFLTRQDVQALEENVARLVAVQLEALTQRINELEKAFVEDNGLKVVKEDLWQNHRAATKRLEMLEAHFPNTYALRLDELTNEHSRISGRVDHAHNRFDILNDRVGRLELVLNALGKVLVPNS